MDVEEIPETPGATGRTRARTVGHMPNDSWATSHIPKVCNALKYALHGQHDRSEETDQHKNVTVPEVAGRKSAYDLLLACRGWACRNGHEAYNRGPC